MRYMRLLSVRGGICREREGSEWRPTDKMDLNIPNIPGFLSYTEERREREKERDNVCVRERDKETMCMCEGERDRMCV